MFACLRIVNREFSTYSCTYVRLVSTDRANDRHAHLDSELKGLQMSLRELETFLKWLQEAETTVNVLADASQREDLSQDTAHVKELRRQLEVGAAVREAHLRALRR